MQVQKINNKNTNFGAKIASTPALKNFKSGLNDVQMDAFKKQAEMINALKDNRTFYYSIDRIDKKAIIYENEFPVNKRSVAVLFSSPIEKAGELFKSLAEYCKFESLGR